MFWKFLKFINKMPNNRIQFECKGIKPKRFEVGFLRRDGKVNSNDILVASTYAYQLLAYPSEYLPTLLEAMDKARKHKDISYDSYLDKVKKFKEIVSSDENDLYYEKYNEYTYSLVDEHISQRVLLKPDMTKATYITLSEAIKLLKSEQNTVLNLCNHGLIKLIELEGVRLIERKSVEDYIQMKKEVISREKVCELLGLNLRNVIALTDKGLLKPIHGPGYDGYQNWYYPKKTIQSFLEKVKKMHSMNVLENKADWMPLTSVNKWIRSLQVETGEIFELIQNGGIRCSINDEGNLKGILLYKADVKKLIVSLKMQRIKTRGFTLKEAAKVIKMADQTLQRDYIDTGKLKISLIEGKSKFIDFKQIQDVLHEKFIVEIKDSISHIEKLIERYINL
ncbi:hypothetical protein V7659_20190 [Neobacillus drentensis]|uniref:hypothetical protein n=1 Tax=Neobacillus drentensis TaxID=220684 RepID=UPI003000A436